MVTIARSARHPVIIGLAAGIAVLVAVAVVVTALGLTVLRGAPGFDRIDAFRADDPAPAPSQRPLAVRVPGSVVASEAKDVLPALSATAGVPAAGVLARQLAPLVSASALGPSVSVDVMDAASGQHLLERSPAAARTPASTAKLITGAAALSALGAQTTLSTAVVASPATGAAGSILLVGGGDVLLGTGKNAPDAVAGHAGLATLAARTAGALAGAGRSVVTLKLDDALFGHQSISPAWSPTDVSGGYVAPVMPVEINAGRLTGDEYARRSPDPGLAAAAAFAVALKKEGITVRGAITRGVAPKNAAELASVQSATVAEQVEFALTQSDNTVAEALARLVAVKNRQPVTFAGAGRAVLAQARKLGVPTAGAVLTDGSGLGDGSRIPAQALTEVLRLAASTGGDDLRAVLTGLPVAAVSGTLSDRFTLKAQKPARGVVRAKTGTLSGVSSLAGTTVDADGRLLVFAVLADQVASTLAARTALDQVASTLAACGCR